MGDGRVEYRKLIPNYRSLGDLDGDGFLTAPELAQTVDGFLVGLFVNQIDNSPSPLSAKIDLLRDIARLQGPKGRLLQMGYFREGASSRIKEAIRKGYTQSVRWGDHVWKTAPRPKGQVGGVPWHPNLLVHGTGLGVIPAEKRMALLQSYSDQIDEDLLDTLSEIARDGETFLLLAHFLQRGGRFEAQSSSGKYESSEPLIRVGLDAAAETAYHELLHYLFDVMDTTLWEAHTSGGLDHNVIFALDDRRRILQAIAAGKSFPDRTILGLFEWDDPDLGRKLESQVLYSQALAEHRFRLLQNRDYDSSYRHLVVKKDGFRPLSLQESPNSLWIVPWHASTDGDFIGISTYDLDHFSKNNPFSEKRTRISLSVTNEERALIRSEVERMRKSPQLGKAPAILTDGQVEDVLYLEMINVVLVLELARMAQRHAFATPAFRKTARVFFRNFFNTLESEGAPGKALKEALDGKPAKDLKDIGREAADAALRAGF